VIDMIPSFDKFIIPQEPSVITLPNMSIDLLHSWSPRFFIYAIELLINKYGKWIIWIRSD